MKRILIIDDNELLSRMLQEALSDQGYEVSAALDANQGYTAAIEFHPDLILLDVQLPDIVGFDLLRVIKNREELKHVPIIMITGTHHQTDHKVKAFQAGADDYVLKPFEMPELLERIKTILRRSQPQKEFVPSVSEPVALKTPPAATLPAAAAPPAPKQLTLKQTLYKVLVTPEKLSGDSYPPVTLLYVSALVGLSLLGWALSAGSTAKPALIGLGALSFWGLCVAFLVMSASVMGISLTWKEGARLICLAGLPLLLKLLAGLCTTLWTSLSPFYFTASPAVFFKSAPVFLERLDIFEIWMMGLVWMLVQRCPGSSKQKAWTAVAVVWPVVAYWQSLWKH